MYTICCVFARRRFPGLFAPSVRYVGATMALFPHPLNADRTNSPPNVRATSIFTHHTEQTLVWFTSPAALRCHRVSTHPVQKRARRANNSADSQPPRKMQPQI